MTKFPLDFKVVGTRRVPPEYFDYLDRDDLQRKCERWGIIHGLPSGYLLACSRNA